MNKMTLNRTALRRVVLAGSLAVAVLLTAAPAHAQG